MSGGAKDRRQVADQYIREAEKQVSFWLQKRLDEKGRGTLASRHEILGIIEEEHHELVMAVHQGAMAELEAELTDRAVACLFGIACIKAGTMDW